MIPRIIHYCWFGGKSFSSLEVNCIDSWKKHLIGFEFMLWDETNTKFESQFALKAYEDKKWAFVSDYVRFKVLNEYGGIYLDTDIFLLKSLEELLSFNFFVGFESKLFIAAGVIGCRAKDFDIQACCKFYNELSVLNQMDYVKITSPKILTKQLLKHSFISRPFTTNIEMNGKLILNEEYFYPLPQENRLDKNIFKYTTENSFAIHLWNSSWVEKKSFQLIDEGKLCKGLIVFLNELVRQDFRNRRYISKVYRSLKKHFYGSFKRAK